MSAEPVQIVRQDEPIRSHGEAVKRLNDTEFLVYILIHMMRWFMAMAEKRWPYLR